MPEKSARQPVDGKKVAKKGRYGTMEGKKILWEWKEEQKYLACCFPDNGTAFYRARFFTHRRVRTLMGI